MAEPLTRTPSANGGADDDGETRAPLGRRRFLGLAGLGAGTLAVTGAAGLTWKSVEGGVFATATGPAYAAWDELGLGGQGPMGLVRAAVLAANAHNAQPWQFRVFADRIDLFADGSRTLGTMDPLLREMDISLGCALENLVLAGPPNGLSATVGLMPEPDDPGHVARVDLASTAGTTSPLYASIVNRHTDRAAYDTDRPVEARQLDGLTRLIDATDTELVWFTSTEQKRAFSDLTIRATEAIIADPRQAADDFAWYRTEWQEIPDQEGRHHHRPIGSATSHPHLGEGAARVDRAEQRRLAQRDPGHPAPHRVGVRRPGRARSP